MGRHDAPSVREAIAARPGWRGLPAVVRARVAAYRVKPRESLWDASGGGVGLAVFAPVAAFGLAFNFLAVGTWWQRLLVLPVLAICVALVTLDVWYVQRPALPPAPGLIQSALVWWRSHRT